MPNDPTNTVGYKVYEARTALRELLYTIEMRDHEHLMLNSEFDRFTKDIRELQLLMENIAILYPRLSITFKPTAVEEDNFIDNLNTQL